MDLYNLKFKGKILDVEGVSNMASKIKNHSCEIHSVRLIPGTLNDIAD